MRLSLPDIGPLLAELLSGRQLDRLELASYGDVDQETGKERRVVDSKVRHAFKYRSKIDINVPLEELNVHSEFDMFLYTPGGHFDLHVDKPLSTHPRLEYTICIYKPMPNLSGGELRFLFDNDTTTAITMPCEKRNDPWLVVLFPIHLRHAATPVTSGCKVLFRSWAILRKQ